jgi:CRISPR-associated protein Cas2
MFVVVSYDIVDDKRRIKVMKTLEGYGRRAQYSVFECDLSARQVTTLRKRLKAIINAREDDVRFYFLCKIDISRVQLLGKASLHREKSFYIV